MPAEWPFSLPQVLLVEGYTESPPNTMLITEMDAGPAKRRQRYTAAPRPISGAVILSSKDQLNDLDEFYVTELKGGTLTFLWQDRNGDDQTYAFLEPPVYEFIEPDKIRVAMKLEIRP
jgi:hypothetical protein